MKISRQGIECLKKLEGCVKKDGLHVIYDDKTGQYVPEHTELPPGATIGYGHLVKQGENFNAPLTEQQATDLLKQDIIVAEQAVKNTVKVPLTQNQYDALVIFAYNIGAKNFKKSTVVKFINNPEFQSSKYRDLESAWLAWNRTQGKVSRGLIKRRQCEFDMYTNPHPCGVFFIPGGA